MSSRYVRRMCEGWMPLLATPYFPTINTEQDPPTPWVTLDFVGMTNDKQTFCGNTLEDGQVSLVFFFDAGVGDDAALQQAEADAAIFFSQMDTSGRLVLLDISPPNDFNSTRSGAPLYGVEFVVGYEYEP